MLKSFLHDITLAVQARSGITPALFVSIGVVVLATLAALAFLCVAAYDWLTLQFGAVIAGLVMAGAFVLIAIIAALAGSISRRRARERAIVERAARAQSTPWPLDPRLLGIALQAGRTLGWQRLAALVLAGLFAAQWAREKGRSKPDDADPRG